MPRRAKPEAELTTITIDLEPGHGPDDLLDIILPPGPALRSAPPSSSAATWSPRLAAGPGQG
jgi:hypothetical protein